MLSKHPSLKNAYRPQQTIRREVSFSGIGIHTGQTVRMRFLPADEGTGIRFRRTDLPEAPFIPATLEFVCDTARSTTIGIGPMKVHTVEHVLAAVAAYKIDNLTIEVSDIEPPAGNGSSDTFVEMIETAGIETQDSDKVIVKLQSPLYWSEGDIHIVALPSEEYRISYTLNYPHTKALKSQFQSFAITPEIFKKEISPCRTFSLYQEVSMLMDRGLIKGGSLDNAVVIDDDTIFSKNGLFFPDEPCRHKILDLIGDLSLVGYDFNAHLIAVCSGHRSNNEIAKKLFNYITMEIS